MLIPLSDDNEDYDVPLVNRAIFFLCTAVFLYELILPEKDAEAFFNAFGFNAHNFVTGLHGWAKFKGALQATFDPRETGWITAVTSIFMHGGFAHISGNLFFLWIFGDNVEHVMGRARYFLFFILTGMLANFAQAFIGTDANVPGIGASGAISAVMGAYLMFYPHANINMCFVWSEFSEPSFFRMKAWMYLVVFLLEQVAIGLLTWGSKYFEVAVWAHFGGFLFGAALAWLFKDPSMLFKEDAERMLGLGRARPNSEYVMMLGRRGARSGEGGFGYLSRKFHRRPSLRAMREKGRAEREETKNKRGW